MSAQPAPRRIWLCADDYGISPGVNRAILALIARGRLNATSVMMVGPAIGRDDAQALLDAAPDRARCAIGLHATVTAPFHPLTTAFQPVDGGMFLPLPRMLRASLLRQLDTEMIRAEIDAQIAAFTALFGRPPDYVDGHQHAQLFPQVRDAVIGAVKAAAPQAWLRQCGRVQPLMQRLAMPKALLLDVLSGGFRRRADAAGLAVNPAFAGAYDFTRPSDFPALMAGFLDGLPEGGLVMCHPGFVDDVLRHLDPLTDQRAREYAFLAGDGFAALLAERQVDLALPPLPR